MQENNFARKIVRERVITYIIIVLCGIGLALDYALFVVPNNFAPAGINGIATMIQYKAGFSIGYFSLIINVPLCIFAYFKIDKTFAIRSLVFCLVYSGAYLLLQTLDLSGIKYDAHDHDTIYPCLIAGLISGVVYGACFRRDASSGGTDIIAKGISKKNPNLEFFWITFALNATVAFVSLFVYGKTGEGDTMIFNYKPVCLCILYSFIASLMGSMILKGHKTAYKFVIVSPHTERIEEEILNSLKHSATRLNAVGIYSEERKDVLICVVNKHQLVDFKRILEKYPDTFVSVETVSETLGNFKTVK